MQAIWYFMLLYSLEIRYKVQLTSRIRMYLKTEIESTSGETSHRSYHMGGYYAGFLKIGEYIEAEASECATPCGCQDNPFVYQVTTPFFLPLWYLPMSNVDTASDYGWYRYPLHQAELSQSQFFHSIVIHFQSYRDKFFLFSSGRFR